MPARARKDIVDFDEVGVYHCYSRVVRRLYLLGVDPATGVDYSYRMGWIEDRVRELQSIFMIDVFATAFLDNHFHTMLRNRPDLVAKASDMEIARRVWMLFPKRRDADGSAATPNRQELRRIINTPGEIAKWRERLSSISWYMWCLKHPIARRANAEDDVTGSFWDGRFQSVRLLDAMAVLMCSVYIDLNEVRAGKATSLDESTHSSIYHRLQVFGQHLEEQGCAADESIPETWTEEPAPEWLSPINENARPGGVELNMSQERPRLGQARPSNCGFLPVTLTQYFNLCDWIGRNKVKGKRGKIPDSLAPLLDRLTASLDAFVETALSFRSRFNWFAGSPEKIIEQRRSRGLQRMHGVRHAVAVYHAEDT